MFKNVAIKDRIGLALLVAMLVTNPLTGQYVLRGLDWIFTYLFQYGSYVSLVATVYLIILGGIYYFKTNRVSIPTKTHKTRVKASEYLA